MTQHVQFLIRDCDGTHHSFANIAYIFAKEKFKFINGYWFYKKGENNAWNKDEYDAHIRYFLSTFVFDKFHEVAFLLSKKIDEYDHDAIRVCLQQKIDIVIRMSQLLKDNEFKKNVISEMRDLFIVEQSFQK